MSCGAPFRGKFPQADIAPKLFLLLLSSHLSQVAIRAPLADDAFVTGQHLSPQLSMFVDPDGMKFSNAN